MTGMLRFPGTITGSPTCQHSAKTKTNNNKCIKITIITVYYDDNNV